MSASPLKNLPLDWQLEKFGNVAKITCGIAATPEYVDESIGVPFFSARNVQDGRLDLTKYMHITEELHKQLTKNTKPEKGDLLLTRVGAGIGAVAVVDIDFEFSVYVSLTLIKCGKKIVNEYLKYLLSSNYYRYLATRDQFAGGGVQNLNVQMVKEYPLPIPSVKEQAKIAKILSVWDKAITTTEQLLANSKQQKKALMQKLLTGKVRFSGFEEVWRDCYLSDVAEIIVSPVDKKSEDGEIAVELCNYTDVYYNNYITRKINFMKATASSAEIKKYTLKVGDVIITKDSETPGDIAVPALVKENLNGVVCGYHLAIVRPLDGVLDGAFLNFLFSMQKTRYYFFTLATGATRFGLSVGGIHKAHFKTPSFEEQQKIASVLYIADCEIEDLKEKIAHLKKEKKALMQQLLTGKRRVIIN